MNSIIDAQADMQQAYYRGAPGIITSATVWLIAAFTVLLMNSQSGIWALIFGGMLIFPISVLFCKVLGRTGGHKKDNPLGPLALEGTVWMLLGIAIAFALSIDKIEWFFPAMLLVIGGRYLTFSTLYGMKIYYLLGTSLVLAACALVFANASVFSGALAGALIEFAFGFIIFTTTKTKASN